MPLKKLTFKPGVNRENTRYTNEGGWYECDKIRFRAGTPEKIGGWQAVGSNTYLGTCRSLWPWITLGGIIYLGVGTNLKYYIMYGTAYNDITPIRETAVLSDPFTTTNGSTTVLVTDTAHGAITGDYVTFSGASAVGGLTLNGEYQITMLTANTYNITAASAATSGATGGGATVTAAYQINVGSANQVPSSGWGASGWGTGTWGVGATGSISLRVWNAANFGEDLVYGPSGGAIYYWDATTGVSTRGVLLSSMSGASSVPLTQNLLAISDTSRFIILFGTNDYGSTTYDPMVVRWSDQENPVEWAPAATNQAGSLRLSHGSKIVAYLQTRQEILVWTDTSLYSMQYVGPPIVWGTNLIADNVSILNDRAAATAAGVTFWMGNSKFYMYNGTVNTLKCDLRQYVFNDFNYNQYQQVFACTNERYNEVWWFYCSSSSSTVDRYVVFNYLEQVWYYGTLERTAWVDAGIASELPVAAYSNKLLYHETGNDDLSTSTPAPIEAYITSSEFDIDDGHNFGFVYRVVPDVNFTGSSATNPTLDLTLLPLANSGSGYNNPESVAGSSSATITRTATVPVEKFTGQVYIRVRGRQMSLKVASTALGVQWQLGSPRIDIRPDGRR